MKINEIRELDVDDLKQKEQGFVEELFKLRFRHASGQLESPAVIKKLKKDIARVKTIMREKGV